MAQDLAYVIITPYTIQKSRTGAVLSRLFGRLSARLVATQMVTLTRDMAERFAQSLRTADNPEHERHRELIRQYIRESMSPTPSGRKQRTLMLVFCGENARHELEQVTGSITISADSGETIRNAYGDLVRNPDGSVRYFEPAVLTSDPHYPAHDDLLMWCDYLKTQPALLENVCCYQHPEKVEQTLVLIKPDAWRERSARPGAIVDMFSRTGLRIIGCKLTRISVNQALQFYGPVKEALRRKLAPKIGIRAKEVLEQAFELKLPESVTEALAREVGIPYAHDQFDRIVEFMTGRRSADCPPNDYDGPGTVQCLALVYEGEEAVRKIRDVLGPTDPNEAPSGTVRSEFGSDVMVNTAHASDSAENAQHEMSIMELRTSNFVPLVEKAIKECRNNG